MSIVGSEGLQGEINRCRAEGVSMKNPTTTQRGSTMGKPLPSRFDPAVAAEGLTEAYRGRCVPPHLPTSHVQYAATSIQCSTTSCAPSCPTIP